MSAATLEIPIGARGPAASLARCLQCGIALEGEPRCERCGREYPEVDGILEAIGPLTGTNRISARFYDSPLWTKFRFWERVFLVCQGPGEARARKKVLRHLPECRQAR